LLPARTGGSARPFLMAHNFFLAMVFYLAGAVASLPDQQERIDGVFDRIGKNR
jgi:hypothetical protein